MVVVMERDEDELVSAAIAAYLREGKGQFPQPSWDLSDPVVDAEGLEYVRVRNVDGLLAVYRVRPNGALKRLKRWPKKVEKGIK